MSGMGNTQSEEMEVENTDVQKEDERGASSASSTERAHNDARGKSNGKNSGFPGHGDAYIHGDQSYPGQQHGHQHGQHHGHGGHSGYPGHHGYAHGFGQQAQVMTQEQMLRSAQASKQMVYEVFANCVTMLEELEHRELKLNGIKPTERSNIYMPDQTKFDDATIQRKLDTQLILLKAQLTSCNEEIKEGVKEELKKATLQWTSGRGDHIPDGITDQYAAKMFELLEMGHTDYPKEFDKAPTISEKGMHKAMQGLISGQHHQAELDKKFKQNPDKEAEAPKIRKSKGVDKGADRIAKAKPKMSNSVDNHRSSWR